MMWTTPIFQPGPARVGKIGNNFVLPRSVPVNVLVAAPICATLGLIVGLLFVKVFSFLPTFYVAGFATMTGGTAGAFLVTFKPWKGESINRVAMVRTQALMSTKSLVCPGSGLPAKYHDDIGTLACPQCGRAHNARDQITPKHQWRRRVYLGIAPIPHPVTGEVDIIAGSTSPPV